ncbi:MAG: DUF1294 domain-containing protein [Clostridia bacterium]|nr:DUF1294 domain-containing protein [Clostridia bacterium]
MSIVGFVSMKVDKVKAEKNKWRIKESTLLLIALFGGALGSFLGMQCFRHKTKHIKFVILVPLFLIIHILLLALYIWRFLI